MSLYRVYGDDGKDDDDGEDEDTDDGFEEDLDPITRACMITGISSSDVNVRDVHNRPNSHEASGARVDSPRDPDSDDALDLLRTIRSRFASSEDSHQPLSLKPLSVLPPIGLDDSDEGEDFDIQAIRRRFSSYERCTNDSSRKEEEVLASDIASQNETSSDLLNRAKTFESFPDSYQSGAEVPDSDEACNAGHVFAEIESTAVENFDQLGSCGRQVPLEHSDFPESARAFVDAIKRNRSYQRFIQNKLGHIEAKIEENKELIKRVKILSDFQATCKKLTRQALCQKKDLHFQLISTRKSITSDCPEGKVRKVSPLSFGPPENPHVANYKMALEKYPLVVDRKKWSTEENANLSKGIIQQIQERMVVESVDEFRFSGESSGGANNLEDILKSVSDFDITPEMMRQFLPKVDWDQVASLYVKGRTSAECEARWLNWEDPLINHDPWTPEEEKNLLLVIQEMGITNWLDIAVSLGTNRTPFQCLVRYQRSLNVCILKREWTEEEDDQLRDAVEMFGEKDWQNVASTLEGRTGTQCSNRWKKSLHPTKKRAGRWTLEEDKRLKVAVTLFGAKNWDKIAQFVPGRIQTQCRDRWMNSLDPKLNFGKWTEEEDTKLKEIAVEYGYSWSKVALHMPPRTDNQCWRRWKKLAPDEVLLREEARRLRKETTVGNFVDRESERPALTLGDLGLLPTISSTQEPEIINSTKKRKRKARECNDVQEKTKFKKQSKGPTICSSGITNGPETDDITHSSEFVNKTARNRRSTNKNRTEDAPRQKRTRRRKNNCMATDAESQNVEKLPLESSESGTSNCMEVVEGRNAERRKNSSKKQKPRRKASSGKSQELDSARSEETVLQTTTTSDLQTGNDHSTSQDSVVLAVTSSEEVNRPEAPPRKPSNTTRLQLKACSYKTGLEKEKSY